MNKIHIKKEDLSNLNHVQVIGKLIKYYGSEISANLSKFTSHNCSYVVLILQTSEWLIWLYYLFFIILICLIFDEIWNMYLPGENGVEQILLLREGKTNEDSWNDKQSPCMVQELAVALLSGRDKAFPFSHLLINCGHWEIRGKPEGEYTYNR